MDRDKVFLDIAVNDQLLGRVIIQNFRQLCTGQKGFGYKGSIFFRIVAGFMCQWAGLGQNARADFLSQSSPGGDITNNNGTGGKSIYGKTFEDENFTLKHMGPGFLSMFNMGRNTNGFQFFISLAQLDGKLFGQVVEGMNIIKEMEHYGSKSGKTRARIVIADCGSFA